MACIALLAPMAMATTQLNCEVSYEVSVPWPWEHQMERQPLRMNWVVVTGNNGSRMLNMQWVTTDDWRLMTAEAATLRL